MMLMSDTGMLSAQCSASLRTSQGVPHEHQRREASIARLGLAWE